MPDGIRIYAIGDVHGRADLLASLLLQIEVDVALHPVFRPMTVLLGDYIDRGPESRQVLDLLSARNQSQEMVFLKGNHEAFLLKFMDNPELLNEWRRCGGLATLISYGLKPPIDPTPYEQAQLARELARVLPDAHRNFLQSLPLSFSCGDFLFVHAGIRPLVSIEQQVESDLIWIRDEFLFWEEGFEKIVVHGHTPVLEPDIRFNRINIDTGAFATGRLTCMMFEGTSFTSLIDVRDWIRELPDIEPSSGNNTGHQNVSKRGQPNGSPSTAAALHAKRIWENVKAYDKPSLARLNPRRPPRKTDEC